MKNKTIHNNFRSKKNFLDDLILNYDKKGKDFGNQNRNSLKTFETNEITINIKSFKIPNIFNQVAYKFFRKSKAQRSYIYANELIKRNINTPRPIAFYEFMTPFLFKKSFYVSEHLHYDLTYRELTTDFNYPNHEKILRAFTKFTFELHEKGIHFLDHSPGNTLIKIINENYEFYLVDLNRMEFKTLDFETRIKNFSRLTTHQSMIEIMSDEYAKLAGENYNKVFNLMWKITQEFQNKFHRKRRFKNKLLFWRNLN
ncbi:Kdo domain containing protein [Flavobacteriaceae bacterium AU392]|nr:Kdo domain containing protein [Flavobacteriaceae bacterium]RKM82781.1 Kdo domain containing protein [Flavobacteriaceae bacterium AU392]